MTVYCCEGNKLVRAEQAAYIYFMQIVRLSLWLGCHNSHKQLQQSLVVVLVSPEVSAIFSSPWSFRCFAGNGKETESLRSASGQPFQQGFNLASGEPNTFFCHLIVVLPVNRRCTEELAQEPVCQVGDMLSRWQDATSWIRASFRKELQKRWVSCILAVASNSKVLPVVHSSQKW